MSQHPIDLPEQYPEDWIPRIEDDFLAQLHAGSLEDEEEGTRG